jgi:hypothetical protein|tara:strand:- start:44 stop:283 length:240 start_codon:yes stop_codon:yes gene_type:complete
MSGSYFKSSLSGGKNKKKISRMWVIRELCKKKHGTVRPTAIQMNTVIRDWNLNRYTIDGKKRSKEEITKAMQRAYASLI